LFSLLKLLKNISMAVTTALSTQIYGTFQGAGEYVGANSGTSYPTSLIPVDNIALVEKYVNTTAGIADGAKVIFKNGNQAAAAPSAVAINETVAAFLNRWNA